MLAGDVLATIEQPQPGPGVGDPTSNCCHVCNEAADCDGMQFHHNSSGSYCVLIANGPSLNKIRWDWQENFKVVMGMNKIYIGLERYLLRAISMSTYPHSF